MASSSLDYISRTVAYKPKPAKYIRLKLSRALSPLEADQFLSASAEACLVQRVNQPTVVMVPAEQKQQTIDLATSMGVAHV